MASTPANNTVSGTPAAVPTAATAVTTAAQTEILPSAIALLQASRIAITEDRPIQLDYFVDTATGKAFLGEDPDRNENLLFKSADEFTSLVRRVVRVGPDFLVLTENSIYVVSGKIKKRKISMAHLNMDE